MSESRQGLGARPRDPAEAELGVGAGSGPPQMCATCHYARNRVLHGLRSGAEQISPTGAGMADDVNARQATRAGSCDRPRTAKRLCRNTRPRRPPRVPGPNAASSTPGARGCGAANGGVPQEEPRQQGKPTFVGMDERPEEARDATDRARPVVAVTIAHAYPDRARLASAFRRVRPAMVGAARAGEARRRPARPARQRRRARAPSARRGRACST